MNQCCLNEKDQQFFNEVYQLMISKYPGMEEKFGMWRIHHHFELDENEILHETSNTATRESTLRIIEKKNLPHNAIETSWKLSSVGPIVQTWCCDDQPM